MTTDTANVLVGEGWRDGLEAGVRGRIRGFIEELLEEELTTALGRARYARTRASERLASTVKGSGSDGSDAADELPIAGHRNGHRDRQVMGTFGATTVSVPRARLEAADGKMSEWHSKALPAYQRRTKEIDAVIAGSYLAGTNTRRVGRALAALFRGSVSKDTVSRTWRKLKGDWDAWNARDLSTEDIARLILDGTVVRVRLDLAGDGDFTAGGAGCARRWAEGFGLRAQHGRRERGGVARGTRRPCEARTEAARAGDRGRRAGARGCAV